MNVTVRELESGTFVDSRVKRKAYNPTDLKTKVSSGYGAGNGRGDNSSLHKKPRWETNAGAEDVDMDKENIHRARPLVSRSRATAVLSSLVVDAPTDCSDIEFEVDDDEQISVGSLYRARLTRISDPKNEHYHFSVYEDPVVN